MLERWTGMMGVRGGVLVALGLALAVPAAGCKKKEDDSEKDEKASKKKEGTEKASKKGDDEESDDDAPKKKKKASADDDDDDAPKKTAKKAKAPKDVDDDEDDDDEDDAPKKAKPKLKVLKGTADVAGTWGVAGKNDAGTKYSGTATITKIGGEKSAMYKASWKIGTEVQQGRCFLDGNVLSCGWAPKHDVGVMAYLVKPGTLDGVWFEEQNTKIGVELLKGATAGDLTGSFLISKGEMPDTKKAYTGSVSIKRLTNGVYTLTWKLSNGTFKGLGLRSNHFMDSDTDVLSAGFNDAGDGGVLQYVIYEGGKTMHGHWAIPPKGGGNPGWGKETMVKAD